MIPNSVFSKNIVLNITRKNREFRFFETLLIRVQDVEKVRFILVALLGQLLPRSASCHAEPQAGAAQHLANGLFLTCVP